MFLLSVCVSSSQFCPFPSAGDSRQILSSPPLDLTDMQRPVFRDVALTTCLHLGEEGGKRKASQATEHLLDGEG